MASSDTEICNNALILIGQVLITSMTEDSKAARTCNFYYNIARKAVLRSHPWNFAIKRKKLASLPDAPVFDFTYAFQLPSDALRILNTNDKNDTWRIEGQTLVSYSSSVEVLYIADITQTGLFDDMFDEALAARIALAIAMPLADSRTIRSDMKELYKERMTEARSADGQEGSVLIIDDDFYLESRYHGATDLINGPFSF